MCKIASVNVLIFKNCLIYPRLTVFKGKKKKFERKILSEILSEISRNMSESIFAEVFSPNLYPPKLLGINVVLQYKTPLLFY